MKTKEIMVYCPECNERIPEDKVIFVDIEEDFQGADVLTFMCPQCTTKQKSRRYG